jgi:putative transposase
LPADPNRLVIGFLPIVHRKLQRNGLHFERIRYWADVLPSIAQPREPLLVRYDPRDLSRVYVLTPSKTYRSVCRCPASAHHPRRTSIRLCAAAKGGQRLNQ